MAKRRAKIVSDILFVAKLMQSFNFSAPKYSVYFSLHKIGFCTFFKWGLFDSLFLYFLYFFYFSFFYQIHFCCELSLNSIHKNWFLFNSSPKLFICWCIFIYINFWLLDLKVHQTSRDYFFMFVLILDIYEKLKIEKITVQAESLYTLSYSILLLSLRLKLSGHYTRSGVQLPCVKVCLNLP